MYETNRTQRLRVPNTALDSKVFIVPSLGDQANAADNDLEGIFKDVLGTERWGWVQPLLDQRGSDTVRRSLNFDAGNQGQEFAVWISKTGGFLRKLRVGRLLGDVHISHDDIEIVPARCRSSLP